MTHSSRYTDSGPGQTVVEERPHASRAVRRLTRPISCGLPPALADEPASVGTSDPPNGSALSAPERVNEVADRQGSALAELVRASHRGLQFSSRMPYEIWSALGARIAARSNATSWWLGDWLVFGEDRYGHRYRLAIETTGLDYQTLRNYAVVARRFKLSRRRDSLSFQHHAEVCALSDEDQDRWLDLASEHHWSKHELRLRVRRARGRDEREEESHVLRLTIDREREQRWREAAAGSDCSLEAWVIQALDAASSSS